MSLWGSLRMISRSLHVPGSDSSAFTTRNDGRPSVCRESGRRIQTRSACMQVSNRTWLYV